MNNQDKMIQINEWLDELLPYQLEFVKQDVERAISKQDMAQTGRELQRALDAYHNRGGRSL